MIKPSKWVLNQIKIEIGGNLRMGELMEKLKGDQIR